jgi:hypothetical protein
VTNDVDLKASDDSDDEQPSLSGKEEGEAQKVPETQAAVQEATPATSEIAYPDTSIDISYDRTSSVKIQAQTSQELSRQSSQVDPVERQPSSSKGLDSFCDLLVNNTARLSAKQRKLMKAAQSKSTTQSEQTQMSSQTDVSYVGLQSLLSYQGGPSS